MGASTPSQVRALLVKSAVYQRRNTATNVCLVVAPIFFCGVLAILQLLANKLILAQRINKCGCQCTWCCVPYVVQRPWTEDELLRTEKLKPSFIRTEQCYYMDTGYCERTRNATCRAYNGSNCGLRFSSPRQAIFCPIQEPSSWPPVMQTPRVAVRAGGSTTQWLPFTGTNRTAARAVAANLVAEPELPNLQGLIDLVVADPVSLLSLTPRQVLALVLPMLAPGGLLNPSGEAVDAAQLSRLEIKFGSALTSNTDYYLENAFINSNSGNARLQFLVPTGRCAATGISNVTSNTAMPVAEMLLRYYEASYPAVVAPLLRAFNITPDIITGILAGSPFSGITAACVDTLPRELENATALDRRLYCGFGKARCDGTYFTREYGAAWNFKELGPTVLKYDAFYNLSLPEPDMPVNYRIHELLNMATKAWTRTYWGNLPVVYNVRNRLMGLMSFPKQEVDLKLDFSVLLGPLFYTWVVQMLIPSFLHQLVYEKEKRLRMMMKMHGLGDGPYWLVTYLWYLMLYIVYIVFFVFFGTLIRLKIFTTSSLTLQAVLYFIFGNNMLAFILMLSSFFSSSRTATVVSFLYIFATGLIGELLLRALMQEDKAYMLAIELLPGFALYRGLFEFSEYSQRAIYGSGTGLSWSNLRDNGNGMISVWIILLAEWPIFMSLGWYFEQILNSGTGASQHPLFFLRWMWRKPDADLKELRAAHPNAMVALGDPVTSAKGAAQREPQEQVASTQDSGEEFIGMDRRGNGGDGAVDASDLRGTAGALAEGVDDRSRSGNRSSASSSSSSESSQSRTAGVGLGRLGGGRGDGTILAAEMIKAAGGDGGMQGQVSAADDMESDAGMLPGRPIEQENGIQRSESSNKAWGRGTEVQSSNNSRRRGEDSSSSRGGGGKQDVTQRGLSLKPLPAPTGEGEGVAGGPATSIPADALVIDVSPEVPLGRVLQSLSKCSRTSRGGSAGGCGLQEAATLQSASPGRVSRISRASSSARSGSGSGGGNGNGKGNATPHKGGLSSPISTAWAIEHPASELGAAASAAGIVTASTVTRGSADVASAMIPVAVDGPVVIPPPDDEAAPSNLSNSSGGIRGCKARTSEEEGSSETAMGTPGGACIAANGGDGTSPDKLRAVHQVPIVVSRTLSWTANLPETGRSGIAAGAESGDGADGLLAQGYDVMAETERVAALDDHKLMCTPIVVRSLGKIFDKDRAASGRGAWLRCCTPQRARVAVRSLTLAIERGECFGLLGPNGAGKTTAINMLTGFLEPTGGDAFVEGCSVRTRMPEIYRMMGVCPQDNLLWEQLTGEEHLRFYGRLKGLKGKDLTAAVDAAVKSVKLHVNNAGKRRISAYSGGMKRRLSVAISFIGNPQVVYLDEPSTGLDPASRRALWDVVREHKDGRAIILTTHSMEEAEILCDRLGIFVDGQLVCIGNPREITSRYAGYLVFTVTVGHGQEEAAKAFVQHLSPNGRLTYALGGTFKYELPTVEVSLSAVFRAMASAKEQMQVLDWGVANATLEEVFIKFARKIGVETRDH